MTITQGIRSHKGPGQQLMLELMKSDTPARWIEDKLQDAYRRGYRKGVESLRKSGVWRGVMKINVDNPEGDLLNFTVGGKEFYACGSDRNVLRAKEGETVTVEIVGPGAYDAPFTYIEGVEEFAPNELHAHLHSEVYGG